MARRGTAAGEWSDRLFSFVADDEVPGRSRIPAERSSGGKPLPKRLARQAADRTRNLPVRPALFPQAVPCRGARRIVARHEQRGQGFRHGIGFLLEGSGPPLLLWRPGLTRDREEEVFAHRIHVLGEHISQGSPHLHLLAGEPDPRLLLMLRRIDIGVVDP